MSLQSEGGNSLAAPFSQSELNRLLATKPDDVDNDVLDSCVRRLVLSLSQDELSSLSMTFLLHICFTRADIVRAFLDACGEELEIVIKRKAGHDIPFDGRLLVCVIVSHRGCVNGERLSGSNLLDLFDGDIRRSMIAVTWALHYAREAMKIEKRALVAECVANCFSALNGVTHYTTFTSSRSLRETDSKSLCDHSRDFAAFLRSVTETTVKSNLLHEIDSFFEEWCDTTKNGSQESLQFHLTECLKNTLNFLSNCVGFATEFTAQLKKAIGVQTHFVQRVVFPHLILSSLQGHECGDAQHAVCLRILRFLSLIVFSVRSLRPFLLLHTKELCDSVRALTVNVSSNFRVEYFAHLVRLVVNADLLDGVDLLLAAHKNLSLQEQCALAFALNRNPCDRNKPLTVFCETYCRLRAIVELKPYVSSSNPIIARRTEQRRSRNRRRRARRRLKYLSIKRQIANDVSMPLSRCDETLVDNDADLESSSSSIEEAVDVDETTEEAEVAVTPKGDTAVADPFDVIIAGWQKQRPFGVPERYLCALSQQLMSVLVITPYGDTFDRATILNFLSSHGPRCPVTKLELYSSDLVVDAHLKRELDVVRFNFE